MHLNVNTHCSRAEQSLLHKWNIFLFQQLEREKLSSMECNYLLKSNTVLYFRDCFGLNCIAHMLHFYTGKLLNKALPCWLSKISTAKSNKKHLFVIFRSVKFALQVNENISKFKLCFLKWIKTLTYRRSRSDFVAACWYVWKQGSNLNIYKALSLKNKD